MTLVPDDSTPLAPVARPRKSWSTVLQLVLLAVVLYFIGRELFERWDEVAKSARSLDVSWTLIGISSALVLLTYAALVETWRILLRAGGGTIPYVTGVRIWTVANLGRYLPGKVWSIGALGVLANRNGVSGTTAAVAALVGTTVNIGAGFGMAAVSGLGLLDRLPRYLQVGIIVGSIGFAAGLALMPFLAPRVIALVSRLRKQRIPPPEIPLSALWIAVLVNICSWVAYGLAFMWFTLGVMPVTQGTPAQFILVYTASYIVGYLALFAPGGIGVREGVVGVMLVSLGMASEGDAILVALLSRLWLTVLEIAPGLVGLLFLTRRERGTPERAS